jgi:hypothetical protein
MADNEKERIYGVRHQLDAYFERQASGLLAGSQAAYTLATQKTRKTVVGDVGEEGVRSFLRTHLPDRYGVGTGYIASFEDISKQMDVVIYDALDCFKIPITEAETLFSVEGTYAVMEVKSSPTNQRNAIDRITNEVIPNVASIKHLHHMPFYIVGQHIGLATYTRGSDAYVLNRRQYVWIPKPIYVLLLGTGTSFDEIAQDLLNKAKSGSEVPDLVCTLDERNYGLCGIDTVEGGQNITKRFWREPCETLGQTLALLLYWMNHKLVFEHFTERPLSVNSDGEAVWPSVLAPVIPRMHVDVSESGTQRSFGWKKETRTFYD